MALFGLGRLSSSARLAQKESLSQLRSWADSRTGVEAFLEPKTSVTNLTLLLVAGDGEFTRRQVMSAADAAEFAREAGIPIYDTNRVGTPPRMRDYAQRMAAASKQQEAAWSNLKLAPTSGSAPAPAVRDLPAFYVRAVQTLCEYAGVNVPANADSKALRELWRTARGRVHPDRNGGDRTKWDIVEEAARALDL